MEMQKVICGSATIASAQSSAPFHKAPRLLCLGNTNAISTGSEGGQYVEIVKEVA